MLLLLQPVCCCSWRPNPACVRDNVKDIDAMFVSFDTDGGGSLDVPELVAAMQELRKEAMSSDSKDALVRERLEFLRSRIKFTHEVAEATREAEEADKRLVDLRDNKSAAARLGAELLKKNVKIADMVTSWDKNREGEIDKPCFAKNVRKMGSEDLKSLTDTELNSLFESLDDDGGGRNALIIRPPPLLYSSPLSLLLSLPLCDSPRKAPVANGCQARSTRRSSNRRSSR